LIKREGTKAKGQWFGHADHISEIVDEKNGKKRKGGGRPGVWSRRIAGIRGFSRSRGGRLQSERPKYSASDRGERPHGSGRRKAMKEMKSNNGNWRGGGRDVTQYTGHDLAVKV